MALPDSAQRLHDLVAQRYVLEADAPAIAQRLGELTAVDTDLPADGLAELLTTTLQSVNGDRLSGGIGLLDIHPVMSPIHYAAPYIAGAFALLTGCPALIVDIRRGYGGHPDTVAYLTSFLFGPEPVHLQDMHSRLFPVRQYWTSPVGAAHTLGAEIPVCVLTSGQTFSGCEEFAYNLQALRRAVIIGEPTSGGAHPSDVYRLTDVLEAHIPVARSVNAVTGTNWEGVGVVPDVACPAADALQRGLDRLT